VPLLSFIEQAFRVIFRLPELWLETWRRLLRHPLRAPLLLALSTRRSFNVALPGPIFFLLNIIVIYLLSSASIFKEDVNPTITRLQQILSVGDQRSLSILLSSVLLTSVATFLFVILARGLGINPPRLVRIISSALVYYLTIQMVLIGISLLLADVFLSEPKWKEGVVSNNIHWSSAVHLIPDLDYRWINANSRFPLE